MVSQTPNFALAVMKVMADRLRQSNAHLASTYGYDLGQSAPLAGSEFWLRETVP
jgi:CRP-like cAMP-binding protein